MKYRRLKADELAELEPQFIRFLAANSVTAGDWEALKEKEPEKAGKLIDYFSEIVFEKVLQDIQYLEYKTPRDIKTFRCGPEKMVMLGLRLEGDTQLDFTHNQSPEQMMQQVQASGAKLQLYQGEKAYKQEREQELFNMMENGARISKDGILYKTLEKLKS